MDTARRIAALLLLAAATCGCGAFERGPEDYPYVAEQIRRFNSARIYHQDLNGDGQDELLKITSIAESQNESSSPDALVLKTWGGPRGRSGQVINQVNVPGNIVEHLQYCDFESDGEIETIVPVQREDSLFLQVVGAQGQKERTLFLTEGAPRREPGGSLPWDPRLRGVHLADVTGDGERELIAVMMTQLARSPRGVWVLDPETGERIGRWTSGAMVDHFVFEDVVGTSAPELLAATGSPNNGAEGNGMDDQHAYLFLLRLHPGPEVVWKREIGGLWAQTYLQAGDIDGDGQRDYVTFRRSDRQRAAPGRIERIDPRTGQPLRGRNVPISTNFMVVTDLDGEGRDEILVLHRNGTIQALGPDLQVQQTRSHGKSASSMSVVPGVIRPGRPEVVVKGPAPYLLGPDLNRRALLPRQGGTWSVMKRGSGQPAYLVGQGPEGTAQFRVAENPAYVLYRWGPWALLGLGVCLVGGLAVWGRRMYRRHRALRQERIDLAETETGGHLLVRADGTVEHVDEEARSMLGLSDPTPDPALLRREVPGLYELLEEIRTGSVGDRHRVLELPTPGEGREGKRVRVHADPLGTARRTWRVSLRDRDASGEAPTYRTWSLLARRVAHDLKNPLTSILLLVDRLRGAGSGSASEEIRRYADRIESRVRSLRRMTTNFMKFVGDEEPTRAWGDLRAFVERCAQEVRRDLPGDIDLSVETGEEVPPVRFDEDQMHSVVENLVSNAIEALPEGGQVTFSVRVERDLQWHPEGTPADYVALEVRDTGVGMDPETRVRVFDPGYTTSEEGAGLGLVIARTVVEDHGGRLEIETEEGVGTAVTAYLPVPEERPDEEALAGADSEEGRPDATGPRR